MASTRYTADEWRYLKLDLAAQLLERRIVRPSAIRIVDLRPWFAEVDHEAIPSLVEDDDCPLELVGADEAAVWLTSAEAAERFLNRR